MFGRLRKQGRGAAPRARAIADAVEHQLDWIFDRLDTPARPPSRHLTAAYRVLYHEDRPLSAHQIRRLLKAEGVWLSRREQRAILRQLLREPSSDSHPPVVRAAGRYQISR